MHSKYQDLVPKQIDEDDPSFERPDEEEIQDNTEKTRMALEKLVSGKVAAAMPVRAAEKQAPAQYIRYSDYFICIFYLQWPQASKVHPVPEGLCNGLVSVQHA